MPEASFSPDTAYGLAEETIRSQPWPSTSTLPGLLARPAVRTAEVEQSSPPPREVVIRRLPADAPLSFVKSVRAVGDLLRLPEGWNSHSAKPIAVRNARTAIELLAHFLKTNTPPPDVVPRVQGGIQLEWHTGKIDIEVYVDSPDKVSFFAEDIESGDDFEGSLRGHEEVLKLWIHRISQK